MGRKSITGGVMPAGISRIRFDFSIDGQRFRPTLPLIPNETNLRRARRHLTRIKAQIDAGTFCFADEFPRYRGLQNPHASSNRDHVAKYSMYCLTREALLGGEATMPSNSPNRSGMEASGYTIAVATG